MADTPDFDNMSPEEMMRWMESLAARQGATEGLTTDANMDIAEVDESDERLADKGDYIPYGWSEERWREQQEKEAAEREARLKEQQQQQAAPPPPVQSVPEPEPQPEPAAPAADAGGTPDFDNMSPEEMMRWMESLAARQGATEGLTTDADMDIAEVDEEDERLEGMQEYKPYGWTDERWEATKAEEAAAREARLKEQQTTTPAPVEPAASAEDELAAALEGDVLAAPDFDAIFGGNNEIGGDDIFGGDNEIGGFDDLDFDTTPTPAVQAEAADDPMSWLTGLSDDSPQEEISIDMDAFGDLAALGENTSSADDDPMGWLAGLAGDDDAAQPAPSFDFLNEEPAAPATNLDFLTSEPEIEEGSTEWFEALGERQGANPEELITGGGFDLPPVADTGNDGPGYEPYSFETGTDFSTEDSDELNLEPAFDVEDADFDPSSWLDDIATNVGTSPIEPVAEESDDFDSMQSNIREQLSSGNPDPDEIAAFFSSAFDKADQRRHIPDYIEEDEDLNVDDVDMPIQADIPDWLRDQMGVPPIADASAQSVTDTGEMMVANLGLEDNVAEADSGLPDWLQESGSEDTSDMSNIFAEAEPEPIPAPVEPELTSLDTSDSWVEAFSMEESEELASWYDNQVATLDGDDIAEADTSVVPAADVGVDVAVGELQVADLPIEANLPEGQPQGVPAWMFGEPEPEASAFESVETEVLQDMSWLTAETDAAPTDSGEMPAWLLEGIDDSGAAPAVAEDEVPDWLRDMSDDISTDEVPDWLRETMDEAEEPAIDFAALSEPAPAPEPVVPAPQPTQMPAVVQQSPAPVPVQVANIDVAATLQEARQQVGSGALDEGLQKYELVVRANTSLDAVVKDLNKLAETKEHKRNPAVLRVLGDGLMRQGKLQDALDSYRKALNSL